MAERSEGKWAAEVFDFVRLFGQFGSTMYGLLLLQLGWLLASLLLARLATDQPTGEPTLHLVPLLGGGEVTVSTVHQVGALVLLVLWVVFSGYYRYPLALLARAATPLVYVIAWTGAGLILAQVLVRTLPSLIRVELPFGRTGKRFRNVRAHKKTDLFIRLALDRRFEQPPLFDGWLKLEQRFLVSRIGRGRIGLVPPLGWTYAEEFAAIKAPAQALTVGVARAEAALSSLPEQVAIRLTVLPPHWRPRAARAATWLRRLFGLDVLCWGSFQAEGTRVWLNLAWAGSPPDESSRDGLFPFQFRVHIPPAVVLRTSDATDAFVLYVALIAQLLARRIEDPMRLPTKRGPLYLRYYSVQPALESLLVSAFVALPDEAEPTGDPMPVRAALTRIVGEWIGFRLSEYEKPPNDHELVRLRGLAEKCARLSPERAEHHYRAAALACLMGDVPGALQAFDRASACERGWSQRDPWFELGRAETMISDATSGGSRSTELALVRSVAQTARALNLGGEFSVRSLQEKLDASWERVVAIYQPAAGQVMKALLAARTSTSSNAPPPPGAGGSNQVTRREGFWRRAWARRRRALRRAGAEASSQYRRGNPGTRR